MAGGLTDGATSIVTTGACSLRLGMVEADRLPAARRVTRVAGLRGLGMRLRATGRQGAIVTGSALARRTGEAAGNMAAGAFRV
jgi:hypothetical protein